MSNRLVPPTMAGLAAAVVFFLSAAGIRQALLRQAVPPEDAGLYGVILALELALLWLPLAAMAFQSTKLGHTGPAALAGGSIVSAVGVSPAWGVAIGQTLQGVAITVGFMLLILGLAALIRAAGASMRGAQLGAALLLALCLSGPWWNRAAVEALPQRSLLTQLAVWLSPGACLSVAFERFNLAVLPKLYSIWLGPVVPYPANAWLVALVYAGLGLLALLCLPAPDQPNRDAGV